MPRLKDWPYIAIPTAKTQTIVVQVNGVSLTEHDVFGFDDAERVAELTIRNPSHPKQIIDRAVRRELLCQYAEEIGLDRSPEYLQEKEERQHDAMKIRVQYLALLYERQSEELKALKESIHITEADVVDVYLALGIAPGDKNEKKIKAGIRKRLSQGKYYEVYKLWLLEQMADVPILVNGRQIPQYLLNESLDALFPSEIIVGAPLPPDLGTDLSEFVLHAAGIREPSAASWQQLWDTELQIGSVILTIGDLYSLSSKASIQTDTRKSALSRPPPASWLMGQFKSIMLAEKAGQEGLGRQLQEHIREDPTVYAPDPRDILARKVWEHLGFLALNTDAFTQEEIDEHIALNQERYDGFLVSARGEEAAHRAARAELARQLQRRLQADFIDQLKASAEVQVLDQRFN